MFELAFELVADLVTEVLWEVVLKPVLSFLLVRPFRWAVVRPVRRLRARRRYRRELLAGAAKAG